jgi:hypothetical protein
MKVKTLMLLIQISIRRSFAGTDMGEVPVIGKPFVSNSQTD